MDSRRREFTCCAEIGDILIIGEQLRLRMHTEGQKFIRDRRQFLRSYSCCFVGNDVVSWLVQTEQAPDRDIAVTLMNILLDNQLFHHVTDTWAFKDDSQLYRFRKDDGSFPWCEDLGVFLRGYKLSKRFSNESKCCITRKQQKDGEIFTNAFEGCEIVSWMVQNEEAATREEAVKEMRKLLENGIMRHVKNNHHFKDTKALFQFKTDFGRERILLDLILPPPQPEYGGEHTSSNSPELGSYGAHSCTCQNRQMCAGCKCMRRRGPTQPVLQKNDNNCSSTQAIPSPGSGRVSAERTESGYHSDQLEESSGSSCGSQNSLKCESEQIDKQEFDPPEIPTKISIGVLIRKATVDELDDPQSHFMKKYIRITSDPVGYGFVMRGDGPVYVKTVDPTGPAAAAGLKVGHYIYSVNDENVLTLRHQDLAHLILAHDGYINLVIMEHIEDIRKR